MTSLLSTVGNASRGQARQTQKVSAPSWFNQESVDLLQRALSKAASEEQEIVLPVTEHYQFANFEAYVTQRGDKDIVVQFVSPKYRPFEDVLPEVVESHFGTTDGFKLHVEPAIQSFGLLMEGIRGRPSYSHEHVVDNFLNLVDKTLSILREA